ncbi:hypothetical protein [Streptomyces sp. NPDC093223]|uniref:hypothetical protein n=1 Tax=Streptomyces sp. NPDC093223 TaxID=3366033 RepID=UPI00380F18AA
MHDFTVGTASTPSPHDPRTCNLCCVLRHPAQASAGRALTRHLAVRPFPRQATNA